MLVPLIDTTSRPWYVGAGWDMPAISSIEGAMSMTGEIASEISLLRRPGNRAIHGTRTPP